MTRKKSPAVRGVSLLLMRDREIGASEFKARCLEIMDEVERLGTPITITKHRRPVARLVPFQSGTGPFCGSLRGMVIKAADLVSPIDVEWDANASHTP